LDTLPRHFFGSLCPSPIVFPIPFWLRHMKLWGGCWYIAIDTLSTLGTHFILYLRLSSWRLQDDTTIERESTYHGPGLKTDATTKSLKWLYFFWMCRFLHEESDVLIIFTLSLLRKPPKLVLTRWV
jgi:hypothetical protein